MPDELLWETGTYIRQYMQEHVPARYVFHNYRRAVHVVQTCALLVTGTDLSKDDRTTVLLAAWFLQTGYGQDPANPLKAAAGLAEKYFTEKGLDVANVQTISTCIGSLRWPQQPITVMAQLLCDADNEWLGSRDFPEDASALRQELETTNGNEYTESAWWDKMLEMLDSQMFFTPFAKDLYGKRKKKNREMVRGALADDKKKPAGSVTPSSGAGQDDTISLEDFKPERTVESLFRNTSRNQMRTIQLADYKANLVVSVNALILTVVLTVLTPRLDANTYLEWPALLLALTSVGAIIAAISASRPKFSIDENSTDIYSKLEKNMLFFGHFYRKTLDEYKSIIKQTITHKPELYDSLSRDIYYQGILLALKYRYLIVAYNIFIWGLIASVLAFIVSFLLHHPAVNAAAMTQGL